MTEASPFAPCLRRWAMPLLVGVCLLPLCAPVFADTAPPRYQGMRATKPALSVAKKTPPLQRPKPIVKIVKPVRKAATPVARAGAVVRPKVVATRAGGTTKPKVPERSVARYTAKPPALQLPSKRILMTRQSESQIAAVPQPTMRPPVVVAPEITVAARPVVAPTPVITAPPVTVAAAPPAPVEVVKAEPVQEPAVFLPKEQRSPVPSYQPEPIVVAEAAPAEQESIVTPVPVEPAPAEPLVVEQEPKPEETIVAAAAAPAEERRPVPSYQKNPVVAPEPTVVAEPMPVSEPVVDAETAPAPEPIVVAQAEPAPPPEREPINRPKVDSSADAPVPLGEVPDAPPPVEVAAPVAPVVADTVSDIPAGAPAGWMTGDPLPDQPLSVETKNVLAGLPAGINEPKKGPAKAPVSLQRSSAPDLELSEPEVKVHEAMGIRIEVKRPSVGAKEYLDVAYDALEAGDIPMAQDYYTKALDAAPDNTDAMFGLASTSQRLGERDRARELYGRILERKPDDLSTLNNFLVLVSEESPREALQELEILENKSPNYDPIPAQIAAIHSTMGNYPAAIEQMARAVDLDPDNLTYGYNLAILLEHNGNRPEAIKVYESLTRAYQDGRVLPVDISQIQERLIFLRSNTPS